MYSTLKSFYCFLLALGSFCLMQASDDLLDLTTIRANQREIARRLTEGNSLPNHYQTTPLLLAMKQTPLDVSSLIGQNHYNRYNHNRGNHGDEHPILTLAAYSNNQEVLDVLLARPSDDQKNDANSLESLIKGDTIESRIKEELLPIFTTKKNENILREAYMIFSERKSTYGMAVLLHRLPLELKWNQDEQKFIASIAEKMVQGYLRVKHPDQQLSNIIFFTITYFTTGIRLCIQ